MAGCIVVFTGWNIFKMGIVATISGYAVPIVKGIVIMFFLILFSWMFYRGFKALGVFRAYDMLMLRAGKKRIMANDQYLIECVKADEKKLPASEFRKELMMRRDPDRKNEFGIAKSKYSEKQIEEMLYLYEILKKEVL